MASTAVLRASYPEFITRWPTPTTQPRCDFAAAVPVVFFAAGPAYPSGSVLLRVHPATRQIWRAQAAIMLHFGYPFRELAGGTLACRRITGGTRTTLHAHGIAKDDNPSTNRYRRRLGVIAWGRETDRPVAMVRAIEAVKLTNGLHPLRWGGRWWSVKDPMHDEVALRQSALAPVDLASLPDGAWSRYLSFARMAYQNTGDEVRDLADADTALANQGSIMVGELPVATYHLGVGEAEFRRAVLIALARIADILMQHDNRIGR
jgi:hypothetical protein